jgi:hypothetical protein
VRLAVLVPVLNRPHRVQPLVEGFRRTTPMPHRVLFIADAGDEAEIRAVQECAGADLLVVRAGTPYARKINAGVQATTEPLIFTGADDLEPHPGWLTNALGRMGGDVQVVGVNDLGTARVREGRHATSFLVERGYVARGTIDEPGVLMHPGYRHNYPDDELAETATSRGAIAFAQDAIVEHLHPHFGNAPDDATYRLGRESFKADGRLFRSRRSLWHG